MRTRRLAAPLLLLLVLVAGCSSAGTSDDSGGGGSGGGAVSESGTQAAEVARDGDGPVDAERQVVVTASASLEVEDVAASTDRVAGLVEVAGGRVEGREEVAPGADPDVEPGWATLTLRVPAEALQTLLVDLDDVGEVLQVTQSESDVTDVARDLDARIEALQTSTDRLLEILATAEDTGDLLATEESLSERQAELESLQAQRSALADEVAMSTLGVSISGEAPPPVVAQGGFAGGLQSGWTALLTVGGVLLVVTGALLPWLVVLGILFAAALGVRRGRRSRRDRGSAPSA